MLRTCWPRFGEAVYKGRRSGFDLEGLGKVRSEVSLFNNKHLQLDFLSPLQESIDKLKENSGELSERLSANNLQASLGFKVRAAKEDTFIPEKATVAAAQESSNIDISA